MGQTEIAEVLIKEYPNWLDYEDVMRITGVPKDNAMRNLRKVGKRTECEIKISEGKVGAKTRYRMKR